MHADRQHHEDRQRVWQTCRHTWGAGIAQWLERQTCDWKVTGSNPCRSSGRIFFSGVNFLCWLLFWYLFHPHVTAAACKRSRSFYQKCRWQVTAKHACTLRMWLYAWSDMVHGCMGYTEHAEMAAVSYGISNTHGFCSFSCFGPHIWNSFPQDLRLLKPVIF